MMTDGEIALGTKVFLRDNKLRDLLNSIPDIVDQVYIADDGRPSELKNELYKRNYEFNLEVIDLEYDKGVGAGRKAIVDSLTEDYLIICDTDHRIPDNIHWIMEQLAVDSSLGGIAGALVEPEQDHFYIGAQDFEEKNSALVRSSLLNKKKIELIAGYPLIRFDFIPNAAVFRKECLEDYCWDEKYVIEQEHADFYVGHWKQTNWEFGVCPTVVFEHYPGGNTAYMDNRYDKVKEKKSMQYFLDKWGYDRDDDRCFVWCSGGRVPHNSPSLLELAGRKYTEGGLSKLIKSAWDHYAGRLLSFGH